LITLALLMQTWRFTSFYLFIACLPIDSLIEHQPQSLSWWIELNWKFGHRHLEIIIDPNLIHEYFSQLLSHGDSCPYILFWISITWIEVILLLFLEVNWSCDVDTWS
jgi:hypothetical protein